MRPGGVIALLIALGLLLGGCGLLSEQVQIASSTSCISKTCRAEPDAPGYQRCESACRSTYGK